MPVLEGRKKAFECASCLGCVEGFVSGVLASFVDVYVRMRAPISREWCCHGLFGLLEGHPSSCEIARCGCPLPKCVPPLNPRATLQALPLVTSAPPPEFKSAVGLGGGAIYAPC